MGFVIRWVEFQSVNWEREKGSNLTEKYWHGSKKIFNDQLKAKQLEIDKTYINGVCEERNSDVLIIDCCSGSCFDCDWVNCTQGGSYSKSWTQCGLIIDYATFLMMLAGDSNFQQH